MGDTAPLTPEQPIWKAAAFGDIETLTKWVDIKPELTTSIDEQGYYPLQWAALNNRVAAVCWLIERGAEVNAVDGSKQTALHWGAVRGCLPAVELLLRAGADPNMVDARGYSVCHVAAQYGHTSLLYHLGTRWNVGLDTRDNDGRNALHWAAYKGYVGTARLLLFLDLDCLLSDSEGKSLLFMHHSVIVLD
ncbi:CLIP170 protein Tip1, partial [Cymbomonas tetramitiformis]